MQTTIGRAERASAMPPPPGVAKGASPLQREINALKETIEGQEGAINALVEKLRPLFCQTNKEPEVPEKTEETISELPTMVRDCRYHVARNTEMIAFLFERLEV